MRSRRVARRFARSERVPRFIPAYATMRPISPVEPPICDVCPALNCWPTVPGPRGLATPPQRPALSAPRRTPPAVGSHVGHPITPAPCSFQLPRSQQPSLPRASTSIRAASPRDYRSVLTSRVSLLCFSKIILVKLRKVANQSNQRLLLGRVGDGESVPRS